MGEPREKGLEEVKDRQVMGDSNAGADAEGGWTGTGNAVSGAGAQYRAGAGRPGAKERVRVGSRNRTRGARLALQGPFGTAEGKYAGCVTGVVL